MSTFQIIVTGVFIFFIVLGVLIFAGFGGLGGGARVGPVVIWGTVSEELMSDQLAFLDAEDASFEQVSYLEKDPATYRKELVDAFASGRAPDLFFLSQDMVVEFSDKVQGIPFSALSERRFRDSFIDEAELFLAPGGIVALPFSVDPLVMYVNGDLLAGAGVVEPPRHWDELFVLAPKLTSLDATSNVKRSAVAFGEWRNVGNVKEILSMLFLQAGENIVGYADDGSLVALLGESTNTAAGSPAEAVLRFYTEFSNPAKSVYSWNRALPASRRAFLAGDLALYFGFASEYAGLRAGNPNLVIRVAPVPQVEGSARRYTFGRMEGLAIPLGAKNPEGALAIALKLTAAGSISNASLLSGLPPVRRDLLREPSDDAVGAVFAESAVMARGWLDPSPEGSDAAFQIMVESTTSGKVRLGEAVRNAREELARLLERQ